MLPKLPDLSLSYEQQFNLQKYKQLIKDIPRHDLEGSDDSGAATPDGL